MCSVVHTHVLLFLPSSYWLTLVVMAMTRPVGSCVSLASVDIACMGAAGCPVICCVGLFHRNMLVSRVQWSWAPHSELQILGAPGLGWEIVALTNVHYMN